VQHSPEGVQDEGLVVNEENFFSHDAFPSAVFPIGSVCDCGGKAQRRIRAAWAAAQRVHRQERLQKSVWIREKSHFADGQWMTARLCLRRAGRGEP
jgi:hypothetical protein